VQGCCARVAYSVLESKEDVNVNAMTGDRVAGNVTIATRDQIPSDAYARVKREEGYPVGRRHTCLSEA
jgi:hypothetical protein